MKIHHGGKDTKPPDLTNLFNPMDPIFAGFDEGRTWAAAKEVVRVNYVNSHGGLDGRISINDFSRYICNAIFICLHPILIF